MEHAISSHSYGFPIWEACMSESLLNWQLVILHGQEELGKDTF